MNVNRALDRRYVTAASIRLAKTATRSSASDDAPKFQTRVKLSSGQCQRYQAYETWPMARIGPLESSAIIGPLPTRPPAMTRHVPRTGVAAQNEGNGVLPPRKASDPRMARAPMVMAGPAS